MAIGDHIRNPLEWCVEQFTATPSADRAEAAQPAARDLSTPAVRRIEVADLWDVLARGAGDFGAKRTDIVLLCLIYPIGGWILARAASGYDLLPLLFPLASGFALVGPVAALGLYEISRRREAGEPIGWLTALGVFRAPGFGAIVTLSLLLFAIYLLWLAAAYLIYLATLGPEPPSSLGAFVSDVFTTGAGWTMIVVGVGVGFLFAVLVLAIGVVSFPLLLDRNVALSTAIETSVRAVTTNPVPMAAWGLIVAGGLVLGSLPALAGLIVVVPLLGHATWHLYRRVVVS